jgi:20S proteasome alpha/beta subunit
MLMLKPLLFPPPKPFVPPRPKRLPRGKRLTIAAGFVCNDGLVLCADTQEVIPGYTKNEVNKIRMWKDSGLCIAITGAGDTELIENAGQLIETALTDAYSPNECRWKEDFQKIIERTFVKLFKDAILPYATFPREDRPYIDLLIAIGVCGDATKYEVLFKASGTTVREIDFGAECIGSGTLVAKSLIERIYSSFLNLDDALIVACYILYHTKRWTDGCGGNTSVVVSSMKNGLFGGGIHPSEVKILETVFDKFDSHTHCMLMNFANPNVQDKDFQKSAKDIQDRLSAIRKKAFESIPGIAEYFTKIKSQGPSGHI